MSAVTTLLVGTGINLNDIIIGPVDVSDYRSGLLQLTVGSSNNGGPVVEISNDEVTWFAINTYSVNNDTYRNLLNQQTSWAGVIAITGKYLRVRVTGQAMSATCTVALFLSSNPPLPVPGIVAMAQNSSLWSPLSLIGSSDGMNTGIASWLQTIGQGVLYNGATGDRWRNNQEVTALASAARTASINSADLTNFNARGVAVVIDNTAGGGAGSLTVKLTGKDSLSGKYVSLFSTGALAAPGVSTYSFQVFPGATPVAQVSGTPATIGKADFLVPRIFRIEVTAADATSYTYSIGVNYLM